MRLPGIPYSEGLPPTNTMKTPSKNDLMLHALSLQIAAAWHHLNAELGSSIECDDLLAAFRSVRRPIQLDDDGKRFGARIAYQAMQGNIPSL
jgi:hypothetical protein